MLKTKTSGSTTIRQDQDSLLNHGHGHDIATGRAHRSPALGGNYVSSFGRPRAAAAGPAAGSGYTARFDGGRSVTPECPGAAAPVDSYTATFGPVSGSASLALTGERGGYTDANL